MAASVSLLPSSLQKPPQILHVDEFDEEPEDGSPLLCPITFCVMSSPVKVNCLKGHTFEKDEILKYVDSKKRNECPLDNQVFTEIHPNRDIEQVIDEWKSLHKMKKISADRLAKYILWPNLPEDRSNLFSAYLRYARVANITREVAQAIWNRVRDKKDQLPDIVHSGNTSTLQVKLGNKIIVRGNASSALKEIMLQEQLIEARQQIEELKKKVSVLSVQGYSGESVLSSSAPSLSKDSLRQPTVISRRFLPTHSDCSASGTSSKHRLLYTSRPGLRKFEALYQRGLISEDEILNLVFKGSLQTGDTGLHLLSTIFSYSVFKALHEAGFKKDQDPTQGYLNRIDQFNEADRTFVRRAINDIKSMSLKDMNEYWRPGFPLYETLKRRYGWES